MHLKFTEIERNFAKLILNNCKIYNLCTNKTINKLLIAIANKIIQGDGRIFLSLHNFYLKKNM